jgi:murein L,D-transpeptidase YcbB/YkuD
VNTALRIVVSVLALFLAMARPVAALENEAVGAAIGHLFTAGQADTGSAGANSAIAEIRDFYAARGFKPVWVRDAGPKAKAKALLAELKISAAHGLSPKFYRTAEIEALMGSGDPMQLARLDMLLTGAFSEYAADLANGRVTSRVEPSLNAVEPVAIAVTGFVAKAEQSGNLRELAGGLLAADERYVRLMAKLAEFARLEASGKWPKIAVDGKPVAAGRSDARMEKIRLLLALAGDLDLALLNGGTVHDEKTQAAVRAFQSRHGLPATGDIDAATLGEMATPIARRIAQIRLNLERRRWQNRELAADHLYINLADMQARLARAGREDKFFRVAAQDGLDKLPTFFGQIVAVKNAGSPDARLVVRSPNLSMLAGAAGQETLAVEGFADLVAGVLDGNAGPNGELARPVEVFVTYLTAWANRDGTIEFRPDRFDRDPVLAGLLFGQ